MGTPNCPVLSPPGGQLAYAGSGRSAVQTLSTAQAGPAKVIGSRTQRRPHPEATATCFRRPVAALTRCEHLSTGRSTHLGCPWAAHPAPSAPSAPVDIRSATPLPTQRATTDAPASESRRHLRPARAPRPVTTLTSRSHSAATRNASVVTPIVPAQVWTEGSQRPGSVAALPRRTPGTHLHQGCRGPLRPAAWRPLRPAARPRPGRGRPRDGE